MIQNKKIGPETTCCSKFGFHKLSYKFNYLPCSIAPIGGLPAFLHSLNELTNNLTVSRVFWQFDKCFLAVPRFYGNRINFSFRVQVFYYLWNGLFLFLLFSIPKVDHHTREIGRVVLRKRAPGHAVILCARTQYYPGYNYRNTHWERQCIEHY